MPEEPMTTVVTVVQRERVGSQVVKSNGQYGFDSLKFEKIIFGYFLNIGCS